MKNWEEMKDFSYVGIKLTKAKTISQGLTRCKIEKLTRQNPVYEHLKVHALIKGRKKCQLCTSLTSRHHQSRKQAQQSQNSYRSDLVLLKQAKTCPLLLADAPPLKKKISKHHYKSLTVLNQLIGDSLQTQAFKKFDDFKQVIQKFDDTVRRTKSQFSRLKDHSRTINHYFLTEADEIDHEINEDRNLTVAKVQSTRMNMIEQGQKERKKRRKRDEQVKEMNNPTKFPMSQQQMAAVVRLHKQEQLKKSGKINHMMHSLIQYKAKANYANKMKVIQQYSK